MTRFCLVFVLAIAACQSPTIRERPLSNHPVVRSSRTGQGSWVEGIDPRDSAAYDQLAAEVERPGGGTAEQLLALADFADRQGNRLIKRDPVSALPWFRDAAVYAAFALSRAHAPLLQARAADRHNHAVEELIRCSGTGPRNTDPAWRDRLGSAGIQVVSTAPYGADLPLDELWIARDFRVRNLEQFGQDGYGVPLVAVGLLGDREVHSDRFFPKELKRPATAVVQPSGSLDGGAWRRQSVVLALHDPFHESELLVGNGGGTIRMASDLTTPIASQFLEAPEDELSYGGLLQPERFGILPGIIMQRPYEPGKIPVLLIHGLASSPVMWLRTVNSLQGDPEIRSRYQFWFAYYPTGAPVAFSAQRLRAELDALQQAIDPYRVDPAVDQMVVMGHSLGGVLTRQLIQSSGRRLEQSLFTRPIEEVAMSPRTRERLAQLLYFEPVPSVRRAVFIMAPHRGSNLATGLVGRVSSNLVQRPGAIQGILDEILRLNDPEVLNPVYQRRLPTSIDNLTPESPILQVLADLPTAPGVPYHSVVGNIVPVAPSSRWSDGVVPYRSAQLDGAESELVVRKSHFDANSAEVVTELRRILAQHLNELGPPMTQTYGVVQHTDPARPARR